MLRVVTVVVHSLNLTLSTLLFTFDLLQTEYIEEYIATDTEIETEWEVGCDPAMEDCDL